MSKHKSSSGRHAHRGAWEKLGWTLMALWVLLALTGSHREMVGRVAIVYFLLLVLVRIAGSRTLANLTSFDMVLLLILSEAAQPALTGENPTLIAALTCVVTLVGLDILFSLAKQRFSKLEHLMEGTPMILVSKGRYIEERLDIARVSEEDILAAGRANNVASLDDIDCAVLERNGQISIIPRRGAS